MPSASHEIDTATRIVAGASRSRYDIVSVVLHWLIALLVLLQFALAELWGFAARPTRHAMENLHVSFGILLTAVIVARIAWRLTPGHRVPPIVSGRTEMLARAMHYLLYVLLVAQAALGFVTRWSEGEPLAFFGLVVPAPFAPMARATHHLFMDLHDWLGWAIVVLAAGHAAAALYHHFVLRDGVLVRMLPKGAAA
jgi:cytochrome b561